MCGEKNSKNIRSSRWELNPRPFQTIVGCSKHWATKKSSDDLSWNRTYFLSEQKNSLPFSPIRCMCLNTQVPFTTRIRILLKSHTFLNESASVQMNPVNSSTKTAYFKPISRVVWDSFSNEIWVNKCTVSKMVWKGPNTHSLGCSSNHIRSICKRIGRPSTWNL